jgi:hypothetical protein
MTARLQTKCLEENALTKELKATGLEPAFVAAMNRREREIHKIDAMRKIVELHGMKAWPELVDLGKLIVVTLPLGYREEVKRHMDK